jgi:hypothetical protein
MNLDYQLSNGNWVSCESRSQEFLEKSIQWNNRELVVKYNKNLTSDQIIDKLNLGLEVKFGNDWYESIRNSDLAKINSQEVQEKISNFKPHYETVEEFDARSDEN